MNPPVRHQTSLLGRNKLLKISCQVQPFCCKAFVQPRHAEIVRLLGGMIILDAAGMSALFGSGINKCQKEIELPCREVMSASLSAHGNGASDTGSKDIASRV